MPQEDLRRFGVDLTERRVTPSFVGVDAVRDRAVPRAVRSAEIGIAHAARPQSAKCIRAARVLYGRILDKIEAQHYDVFSSRASVSTTEKAVMVAKLLP